LDSIFLANIQRIRRAAPRVAALLTFVECAAVVFRDISVDDIGGYSVLCIYGVDAAPVYYSFKEWLREDPLRRIIFVEDDISKVRFFAETEQSAEILGDDQVYIYDNFKSRIAWDCLMLRIKIMPSRCYERDERYVQFKRDLEENSNRLNTSVVDSLKFDGTHYSNVLGNLSILKSAKDGLSLDRNFKNIPAIICGGGPSLQENVEVLKTLQDKALIIAGGAAINACYQYGVKPHVIAAEDPTEKEYRFFRCYDLFETALFYRSRLNTKALRLVHGDRVFFCDKTDWPERALETAEGESSGGFSVTNFAMGLAKLLGCNPIILVGVDLALRNGKKYPCIVDYFGPDVKEEPRESQGPFECLWDQKTTGINVKGEEVITMHKWLIERSWCSRFALAHPEKTFINTSNDGLDIDNITNMSLESVAQDFCNRNIADYIHNEIQQLPEMRSDQSQPLIDLFMTSLKRCQNIITECLNHPLDIALYEAELEEEPAYQNLLRRYYDIYDKLLSRVIPADLYNKIVVFIELEKIVEDLYDRINV
jgi:hypothetical protein